MIQRQNQTISIPDSEIYPLPSVFYLYCNLVLTAAYSASSISQTQHMQTGIHSFLSETYSSTIWAIPVICPGIYRITQTKDIFMLLVTGTMPYIQKEVIQICLMNVRFILLSYFSPSVFLLLPPKNFPNLYHSLSSRCHCVSIVCHYLLPGIFYDFLSGLSCLQFKSCRSIYILFQGWFF